MRNQRGSLSWLVVAFFLLLIGAFAVIYGMTLIHPGLAIATMGVFLSLFGLAGIKAETK